MTGVVLERIEAELKSLRLLVEGLSRERVTQQAFSVPDAARALGVGLTKMRELAKADVAVVVIGGRKMVPRSEIERLTTPMSVVRQATRGVRVATKAKATTSAAEARAWRRAELKKRR